MMHGGPLHRNANSWPKPWPKPWRLSRVLALFLSVGAVASGILTYGAITQSSSPFGPDPHTVLGLVLLNLALLLALVAVIARRALRLWQSLKQGTGSSRLQTRIITMFSVVTIVPTLIVSVFSTLFFAYGIESWFDQRVSTALEESVAVAEAYLKEHKEVIRADAITMASDLNSELYTVFSNPALFNKTVSAQAALRNLNEAIVFQRNRILAQTRLSFSLAFEQLPPEIIERAQNGEVVIMTEDEDRVRALIKLENLSDTYLLVGRLVDAKVLTHMLNAQGAVSEYRALNAQKSDLQIKFSIVFVMVALLLLLAALWYGMIFAARLMSPIGALVNAAERVRAGDFSTQVILRGKENDEFTILGRTFNRMTQQLEAQRGELIAANRELDERRRFTEAVLDSVSAGVVALGTDGAIQLANRAAGVLLADSPEKPITGQRFTDMFPDLREALSEAARAPQKLLVHTLTLPRGEKHLTVQVRISAEFVNNALDGFIVTIDDITQLVTAQRSAAWADVARRVAHEIKNPLTPIQLAAERLKKKYLAQIQPEDAENYTRYIDTISRHVRDIGKMVEEFVSFARMPQPVFHSENMAMLLKRIVFSEQTAHPDIRYDLEVPPQPLPVMCDEGQVGQVFTNILKNAAESLETQKQEAQKHEGKNETKNETKPDPQKSGAESSPRIAIRAYSEGAHIYVEIRDNGPGFPAELIDRLTDPYVTTRNRGTGLGLSIAKKIMEDHKGALQLSNNFDGGAMVLLSFLKNDDINATGDAEMQHTTS